MAKKLWIKLWPDLLASSPRWHKTSCYQAGVYMNILIRVDDVGALRSGSTPWKPALLAEEMRIDKRHTKKLEAAIARLVELDLLSIDAKDGAICVCRHERLQGKRNKT
jgi:hypothetical protein